MIQNLSNNSTSGDEGDYQPKFNGKVTKICLKECCYNQSNKKDTTIKHEKDPETYIGKLAKLHFLY